MFIALLVYFFVWMQGGDLTLWRNFSKSAGAMLLFIPALGSGSNCGVCHVMELYILKWKKTEGIYLLLGIERK